MDKQLIVIQSPLATRSGYGDFARDICRHVIELYPHADIKLISLGWGQCPMDALSLTNPRDTELIRRIAPVPLQLNRQPDVFMQISVPNEFQALGKYNIGITAMIETTMISKPWMEGLNRMDVNVAISNHGKLVAESTTIEEKNQQGQIVNVLKLNKPIEVLHNCVDLNIFRKLQPSDVPQSVNDALGQIDEDFCFLFVGHWLRGNLGEDRKNVGLLVKTFLETFKDRNPKTRPALILKTSGAGFSLIDREEILTKIAQIKATCTGVLPNIYVLHGDLTDIEMNGLYNHPKVKCHVSFTKGEGFGRPLLEATLSQKPIIASGWSGHLDFLDPENALLVGGELKSVDGSAVWDDVIIRESQWFNIDVQTAQRAMWSVWKNPSQYFDGAYRLAKNARLNFNYDTIRDKTKELLDKYIPPFAAPIPINLNLPKIQTIDAPQKLEEAVTP